MLVVTNFYRQQQKNEILLNWIEHQMQSCQCDHGKLDRCGPAHTLGLTFYPSLVFHMHAQLVISLRGVPPPTTCPLCLAALKAWQTPPLVDSLQPTCLTSSVSRTRLMEMADQRVEIVKRREMSNEDLICEFPACLIGCFASSEKSLTIVQILLLLWFYLFIFFF